MSRPQRCRRICALPQTESFGPAGCDTATEQTTMAIDEFEVIRLLDLVGLTQEQCATRLGVSRTTVTAIYNSARFKMADALVHGKRLLIEGGHVKMCEHAENCNNPNCCPLSNNHKGD